MVLICRLIANLMKLEAWVAAFEVPTVVALPNTYTELDYFFPSKSESNGSRTLPDVDGAWAMPLPP